MPEDLKAIAKQLNSTTKHCQQTMDLYTSTIVWLVQLTVSTNAPSDAAIVLAKGTGKALGNDGGLQ